MSEKDGSDRGCRGALEDTRKAVVAMFADDLKQEAVNCSRAPNNHKPHNTQPACLHEALPDHPSSARGMHWTEKERELMGRIKSEMDKPRLTISVRNALEAEGEQAAEALARYSKIA